MKVKVTVESSLEGLESCHKILINEYACYIPVESIRIPLFFLLDHSVVTFTFQRQHSPNIGVDLYRTAAKNEISPFSWITGTYMENEITLNERDSSFAKILYQDMIYVLMNIMVGSSLICLWIYNVKVV